MRHPCARPSVLAVFAACSLSVAECAIDRTAWATDAAVVVAVVSPAGSRLADDIRRELALSRFTVLMVARGTTTRDAMESARELLGADLPLAVVVRADERQILVVSRASPPGRIQTGFELQLDSPNGLTDGLTRRHACLTVVEYVRVLGHGGERGFVRPVEAVSKAADVPVASPTTTAAVLVNAGNAPPPDDYPSRAQTRTMGVATAVDVSSTGGRPSGHLHFMWYFPLATRVSFHARARWPVVGVAFQSRDADVRMWTFGAALGVQYSFREAPARWRPLLGIIVGNNMLLTEASSPSPTQTRSAVTPSATVGILGGLRYALGHRAQLLWEVEAARGWMVASASNRTDYETAAANAFSVHASFGVLFEY